MLQVVREGGGAWPPRWLCSPACTPAGRSRRRGSGTPCRWRADEHDRRRGGARAGLPAWRVLYEAARRRHGLWGEAAGGGIGGTEGEPGGAAAVPLPLSPATWRELLRRDGLADDQLAVAIVADRRSALLYRGLAALDEPTLAALAADPDAVQRLHSRHADVLAAFGARFRVSDGAVMVPGGQEEEPVWGLLMGESPRSPVAFLLALLESNGDAGPCSTTRWPASTRPTSASLSGCTGRRARRAWAPCSPWPRSSTVSSPGGTPREAPSSDPRRTPRECFGRCASGPTARSRPRRRGSSGKPFSRRGRQHRARTGGRGCAPRPRPTPPGWRSRSRQALRRRAAGASSSWSSRSGSSAMRGRARRTSWRRCGAFPRRVPRCWRSSASGTRDPGIFAAAVGAAHRAGPVSHREGSLRVHGALQGALAVVDRARFGRTLDLAAAERLVRSLCEVPGGRGPRSAPRGVGRGGAPARARPCGPRRAAAGRAGDDDPASDGRRPGRGA